MQLLAEECQSDAPILFLSKCVLRVQNHSPISRESRWGAARVCQKQNLGFALVETLR